MVNTMRQGEAIRRYILDHVDQSPNHIAKLTAGDFKITRQAVNKHLKQLVKEGILERTGTTSGIRYQLVSRLNWHAAYPIDTGLEEHVIWDRDISDKVSALPMNVKDIWYYGFSEIFNNAIEHAEGSQIDVLINGTAAGTEMMISDDGYGIFRKIKNATGLPDERSAVLELAKGKLTTDPDHHTGEGIFFTSRIFDFFEILSGKIYFAHAFGEPEDWISEDKSSSQDGTCVRMKINNHSTRTVNEIFDRHTSGDDYGFTKTVIPIRIAAYGNDKLISRSLARRVVARLDLFNVILFDFNGVEFIGQAFADEIFRVFAKQHPQLELVPVNTGPQIQKMIDRVCLRHRLNVAEHTE